MLSWKYDAHTKWNVSEFCNCSVHTWLRWLRMRLRMLRLPLVNFRLNVGRAAAIRPVNMTSFPTDSNQHNFQGSPPPIDTVTHEWHSNTVTHRRLTQCKTQAANFRGNGLAPRVRAPWMAATAHKVTAKYCRQIHDISDIYPPWTPCWPCRQLKLEDILFWPSQSVSCKHPCCRGPGRPKWLPQFLTLPRNLRLDSASLWRLACPGKIGRKLTLAFGVRWDLASFAVSRLLAFLGPTGGEGWTKARKRIVGRGTSPGRVASARFGWSHGALRLRRLCRWTRVGKASYLIPWVTALGEGPCGVDFPIPGGTGSLGSGKGSKPVHPGSNRRIPATPHLRRSDRNVGGNGPGGSPGHKHGSSLPPRYGCRHSEPVQARPPCRPPPPQRWGWSAPGTCPALPSHPRSPGSLGLWSSFSVQVTQIHFINSVIQRGELVQFWLFVKDPSPLLQLQTKLKLARPTLRNS